MSDVSILPYLTTPSNAYADVTPEVEFVPVQIVDEKYSPLPGAAFWYIDENSQQISNVIYVLDDGKAEIWLQTGDNPDTRWLNFWKDGYEPIVKSVTEIKKNYQVVLKKVGEPKKVDWGIVFAGTGLAVTLIGLAAKKKRSVSGIKDRAKSAGKFVVQRWQGASTKDKVITIGAAVLGGYVLYKIITHHEPTEQQKAEINAAKQQLKDLAYYGIFPSATDTQFSSWANEIVSAVDDCGTDEDTIYRVFNSLKNIADVYKLIIIYGVSAYKGCFEGSYFGNVHRTLSETLTADLSNSNISTINDILRGNNIQYSF
jgi:hypothetical protein